MRLNLWTIAADAWGLSNNTHFCVPWVCLGNYQNHLLFTVNKRPMVTSASIFRETYNRIIDHMSISYQTGYRISLVLAQISFHSFLCVTSAKCIVSPSYVSCVRDLQFIHFLESVLKMKIYVDLCWKRHTDIVVCLFLQIHACFYSFCCLQKS